MIKKVLSMLLVVLLAVPSTVVFASTNVNNSDKQVMEKYLHSVVQVHVEYNSKQDSSDCSSAVTNQISAAQDGTGFFIDDKHVVTNYHTINIDTNKYDLDYITLRVNISGETYFYEVKVVATDPEHDLSILELKSTPTLFKPVPLQLVDDNSLGTDMTVGYPMGIYSVSHGDMVSTNTALLIPGDHLVYANKLNFGTRSGGSGSPVINKDGKVTSIVFASYYDDGVSYSIPAIHAIKLAATLKQKENTTVN